MDALLIVLAGAVGLPLVVGILLAICGAIVLAGEWAASACGLDDSASVVVGAFVWFAFGGAALGAWFAWSVA